MNAQQKVELVRSLMAYLAQFTGEDGSFSPLRRYVNKWLSDESRSEDEGEAIVTDLCFAIRTVREQS
jgi:hypothetical protein